VKKNHLARKLSEVSDFREPKVNMEQYLTPAHLAADLVYTAYMQGDIEGRKVVDLGAGTGVLSIGSSLIGGEVTAVEKDHDAVEQLKQNAEDFDVDLDIIESDFTELDEKFDTVVMNPPFSVHSDLGIKFWEKAVDIGSSVYAISPRGQRSVIKDFVGNSGLTVVATEGYTISLPPTFGFHTEASQDIEVDIIIAEQKEED